MKIARLKDVFKRSPDFLQVLTPSVFNGRNKYYVSELRRAIRKRNVKNIALSGGYGSGKSSILEQLRMPCAWSYFYKTKIISLMATDVDRPVATTITTTTTDSGKTEITTESIDSDPLLANRLRMQKEIFKQLFYGENPSKLRRSKYSRVGRDDKIISIFISYIFSLIINWYLLQEYIIKIYLKLNIDILLITSSFYISVAVLAYFVFSRIASFVCDHPIKSFGFKDLSVDLSDSMPEFEQMIDEIIYFFKRTKYKIVILEDLDRFNDPLIYEELRQLNIMINNAQHIRRKVVFIYALKDGLISDPEIRSKIFDFIVPVVPFITADNMQDHIHEVFLKYYKNSDIVNISKVLARHVVDMRLLKSIYNSSVISWNILFSDTKFSWPSKEKMIAMVIIREMYPAEFEDIRKGDGFVNDLYHACVESHQNAIELARIDVNYKNNIIELAKIAGSELWDSATGQLPANSIPTREPIVSYGAEADPENNVSQEDMFTNSFWERFSAGEPISVTIPYRANLYSSEQNYTKTITAKEAETISLNVKHIINLSSETIEYFQQKLDAVCNKDKFQCFEWVLNKDERLLSEINAFPIIRELLELDLIDENYQSYLSPFIGATETYNTRNFKVNCMRGGKSDYYLHLEDEEIKMILDESDVVDRSSPAFYNLSIFNYLIKHGDNRFEEIICPPSSRLSKMFEFYNLYCLENATILNELERVLVKGGLRERVDSDHPILKLTARMAEIYPVEIFENIVHNNLGDSVAREVLFDVALLFIKKPEELIIKQYVSFFDYYSDNAIANGAAMRLAKIIINNGGVISRLDYYKNDVATFNYIIESGMLKLNGENILLIKNIDSLLRGIDKRDITEGDVLSILSVEEINKKIKEYVISRISQYIKDIKSKKTIELITEAIKKYKIALDIDNILSLIDRISDEKIIEILLLSKLSVGDYRLVLENLSDPYPRLAKEKARPKLNITKNNVRLINKLDSFGMVKNKIKKDDKILVLMSEVF
jgi:hypothetical protein